MDQHKNHRTANKKIKKYIQNAYNTEWYDPKYKKNTSSYSIYINGKGWTKCNFVEPQWCKLCVTWHVTRTQFTYSPTATSVAADCVPVSYNAWWAGASSKHTNSRWERIECVMAHYPQRAPIDQMLCTFIYANERDSDKGYKGLWLLIMNTYAITIFFLKAPLKHNTEPKHWAQSVQTPDYKVSPGLIKLTHHTSKLRTPIKPVGWPAPGDAPSPWVCPWSLTLFKEAQWGTYTVPIRNDIYPDNKK